MSIPKTLNLNIFWGSMSPCPLVLTAFGTLLVSSCVYTFKILCYALDPPWEFFDCVLILCDIYYFLHKAPSHKFVVSHWGRTSSLVAKLTSTGQPSNRGSWKSSSVREGCNDCSRNRQGNITAIKSDKPTTSKNWPAWLTVTPKSPGWRAIMKITTVLQPVIMSLLSLNKVSSSSSLSSSVLSYFSLPSSSSSSHHSNNFLNIIYLFHITFPSPWYSWWFSLFSFKITGYHSQMKLFWQSSNSCRRKQ